MKICHTVNAVQQLQSETQDELPLSLHIGDASQDALRPEGGAFKGEL